MSRKMIFRALAGFMFIALSFALPSTSFAYVGEWTIKSDMPTAKYGLSTSEVNGKIYAIGGVKGGGVGPTEIVEEYDPATDTWRRRTDMPSARYNLSTSVVHGKIYTFGGYHTGGTGTWTVEEYNPATNTWRARADMPTPTERAGLSTSVVDGKIYAIGGNTWDNLTSTATYFSTVEEYDPATDTWTSKADMPTTRSGLSTSVVNGKIYAIGGESSQEISCLSTVEVYDPMTDTWTPKADMMPTARFHFSTSVVDGRIYAIGGQSGPWPEVTSAVEAYQPAPWVFAHSPNPADGSMHPDTWVALSWDQGDFAVSHDVYLGDIFDDVNDGLGDTFRGNQTTTSYAAGFPGFPYPDGLVRGTTYYWRVDEVNETEPDSPWRGDVWSFTVQPKIAYNPNPADGAEFVDLDVELNWSAGLDAAFHIVYFGDNFDDVNNATRNPNQRSSTYTQSSTTYTPGPLDFGKTYYWRVDELTGGRGAEMHKGEVWSFISQGAAGSPDPSNDATSVEMNATLSWTPAEHAASHQVYFGTEKEAVRNANTGSPEYKGTQTLGAEIYGPGVLSWDTTYYWRVDEVNNTHPDSPWPGSV